MALPKKRKTKRDRVRQQLQKATAMQNAYNVDKAIDKLTKANETLVAERSILMSEVHGLKRDLQLTQLLAEEAELSRAGVVQYRNNLEWSYRKLKDSLQMIRDLHTGDYAGFCKTCQLSFPCETIQAIRIPEQAIINSLLNMERELREVGE